MIEVDGVSKRYGRRLVLDEVSFTVEPGKVTGFLGPNGAGKTTTLRIILGLDRADSGRALVNGLPYQQHHSPIRQVGALLDSRWVHPSRSAYSHLGWIAASQGLPRSRVDEVLELTGLDAAGNRAAGRFSLGMSQRLGIAAALLGDPAVLVLDEPVNGLDPEGVHWLRGLLRDFADRGRTVFLSSHLMSEMALIADHLIVLGRGRVLADGPLAEVVGSASMSVTVRTPKPELLTEELTQLGAMVTTGVDGLLTVSGVKASEIGDLAARISVALHQLHAYESTLEDAYFELTGEYTDYQAGGRA